LQLRSEEIVGAVNSYWVCPHAVSAVQLASPFAMNPERKSVEGQAVRFEHERSENVEGLVDSYWSDVHMVRLVHSRSEVVLSATET